MKLSRTSYISLILLILIFGIKPFTLSAQTKDLRVVGNTVNFFFKTISHYQTGITLTGCTRVKIRYQYPTKDAWKLKVWAVDDNVIRYEGMDVGDRVNDIPLSDLLINAAVTSSNDGSINPTFELSNDENDPNSILMSGSGLVPPAFVNVELTISYSLGVPPNNLNNNAEGLYYVSLKFLLEEQ
jgi:hypothetical protein